MSIRLQRIPCMFAGMCGATGAPARSLLIGTLRQFAKRIEAIEQKKHQAQANLAKSNDLFNNLLQRAFTGELTAWP